MRSLWNDEDAAPFLDSPLALRAYTSRLLGQEPSLVLHGGGNTSAKATVTDLFGDQQSIIYVKGSGWDLATIEPAGFAPVRIEPLLRMAELERLSDSDMVRAQRAAMIDPAAPTPSVEAILHAIIPHAFVDHTHADAVVAVSNTPNGRERIESIYGDRVLIVPYVMPGFVLAKTVRELSRGVDWETLEGIVLLNHGVFSFGPDARSSYERMIALVSEAERYLEREGALAAPEVGPAGGGEANETLRELAALRLAVGRARGAPVVATLDDAAEARGFADLAEATVVATRGPLTPDHVIRTKPLPCVAAGDWEGAVARYAAEYQRYFDRHAGGEHRRLDPAPRWIVWPGVGSVGIGGSARDASIVTDLARHTTRAIQWAERLDEWRALPEADLFAVEYWELEQAKLRRAGPARPFAGQVALVTGAARGIGRATAEALRRAGAAVAAVDLDPSVERFVGPDLTPIVADLTDPEQVEACVRRTVRAFGGLDVLVSNAGLFPPSRRLEAMDDDTWERSLALNLDSHRRLLRAAHPFLALGFSPAVVIVASKNVPAPGPGAGAYSVAKAGLTQLARVAALEWAADGIRVNVLHPHLVLDTGAWSDEVVADRARHYGLTPEAYRTNNLLRVEITSADVASAVVALAGPTFGKTTGAQIPIDGGSDRVV
ncbi:MAG: bifunctional aldolase/short-chain dehydrogenase [Gemmatimonadales bacterium]